MSAADAHASDPFDSHLRHKNTSSLGVIAILISALVPLFWVLDWLVIPRHVWVTFGLRLTCTLYGLLVLTLISARRPWVKRHVYSLTITLTLMVSWSIAVMCWFHHGYESHYYAGINLVIIGAGFLFSWPQKLWGLFLTLVYAFYLLPLVTGTIVVRDPVLALSNQFFIIATMVLIVASQRHRYALERREFEGNLDLQQTKVSLEQAVADLRESDRLKSQFFNNITHELRTPLTMILSPLDGILEGQMGHLAPEQRPYLEPIRRNALKLLKLINDLLDVARIEDGHMRLRVERADLRALLQDVIEHARPLAARKSIQMELSVRSLRDDVFVDVEQLERVIVNLVSNALKFTDPGGRIVVWLQAGADGVHIGVQDNGIGIAEDKRSRIFERFSQADGSITRRYGGTGIGLALAKEIVELHGGSVTVTSSPGEGSEFVVHLRPGREHLDPQLIERRREKQTTGSTQRTDDREPREWLQELLQRPDFRFLELDEATERRLAGRSHVAAKSTKVVVVEDNVEVLRFLHLQLQEEHAVYLAQDGAQGLDLIRQEHPDVIVTDYMMPNLDGLSMLRELKANEKTADIPAVMLTAKGDVDDRLSAREAGADIYLTKPFSPRELRAAVRQLLAKRGRAATLVMREHVKSLEIISAGLAHEIHNPLSYVKNAVFVIEERAALIEKAAAQVTTADGVDLAKVLHAREQITRMRAVAERGIARIEQVVDLVRRYAREGYPEEPTPLRFDDAVRDVGRLVVPSGTSEVSVKLDLRAEGALVKCVPEEMHQVIRNLWQNAFDALGDRGHIELSTRVHGNSLVFEVKDDGPGIPSDRLPQIFTPFFTTKPPGKGMGLGLAVTHQVVEKAGGTIRVQSVPGSGSVFQVRLPLAAAESGTLPAVRPP